MPRPLSPLLLCALLGVLAAACGQATGNPGVAATVNGEQILVSEVQEDFLAQAGAEEHAAVVSQVGAVTAERQAVSTQLGQHITALLLEDALQQAGLEPPTAEEVDERLQQILDTAPPDQLQQALQQQGLTMASLPEELRLILMQERLADLLLEDVEVTEEDLRAAYTQRYQFPEVAHILVESQEQAQQALARLEAGEDFATVAAEVSIDPGSAAQGGSLGQLQPGVFIPEFEQAALALQPGEISEPVQTQFGWHLIRTSPPPEFDDVRGELEADAQQQASSRVVQEFFNDLLFGADVEVNPRFGSWDPLSRSVRFSDPLGELQFAEGVQADGGAGAVTPPGGQAPPQQAPPQQAPPEAPPER